MVYSNTINAFVDIVNTGNQIIITVEYMILLQFYSSQTESNKCSGTKGSFTVQSIEGTVQESTEILLSQERKEGQI